MGTLSKSSATSRRNPRFSEVLKLVPGVALICTLGITATFLSARYGGPLLLYTLLLGMAFHYLSSEVRTRPGIEFCGRTVLRFGVALLGARITLEQISALGWSTALVVAVGTFSTVGLGFLLARLFGMDRCRGVLVGGSVGICGASAALAIASVLPQDKDGERFTLLVVVSVTLLSTIAMVLYPMLSTALELPPQLAGVFLGGTIHDVAQVAGAGYMLGEDTGDTAILVKLFRVSLLVVVVMVVALGVGPLSKGVEGNAQRTPALPWFLWAFMVLLFMNSVGVVPTNVRDQLGEASRICIVLAVAALGMKTSLSQLQKAGWRPFALALTETLWLALFVLAYVVYRKQALLLS